MNLRRTAAVVASAILLAIPSVSGASTTPPADNSDNAHLFTIGEITIPEGEPDSLSVVLVGPALLETLPVIVRNNTDETFGAIDVSVIARDAAGEELAAASARVLFPPLVQPGQWAIGSVRFDTYRPTGDEQLEFTADGDGPEFAFGTDLTVTEATMESDDTAMTRVVGILQNNSEMAASLEFGRIAIACFDGPSLVGVHDQYLDGSDIEPGASVDFTVTFQGPVSCTAVAVAAWGAPAAT